MPSSGIKIRLSRSKFREIEEQIEGLTVTDSATDSATEQSVTLSPDPPSFSGNMVLEIKRQVKLVTEQRIIDKPAQDEAYPMRSWNVEVYLMNQTTSEEMPATVFTKAVYNLHPSFAQPVQTFDKAPFRCENEGWGEFDMTIDLYTTEKGGKNTLNHDLNFGSERYESLHTVTFRNPSQALISMLRESGPIPGEDANGARKAKDGEKKRSKKTAIDMEKLGDNLVKLQEDDLLYVVQLIHDNKNDDTYTMNDPDGAGEFHVDLYTLPDNCIKLLQAYCDQKLR